MFNAEHLAFLKQGVEGWNRWRSKTPKNEVDLSRADLSRADLSGADLSGADLRKADLHGADLHGAILYGADLRGAFLPGTDLSGAFLHETNLSGAFLYGADLHGVFLRRANLNGANLSRANLSRANLKGVYLKGANLRGANLRGANLRGANLRQANFIKANLKQTDLTQADLVAANLVNASLESSVLLGANLQGANLRGAVLDKASLVKANLRLTNLSWAKLRQTNLLGADLSQATLCNADLTRTALFRAVLNGADLRQATLKESVCEAAQFTEAKLGAAIFYKADLTDASFYKADAIGVDFSRAVLTGACIEDWNINSATSLKDVVCDYVYLRENNQERRPHGGSFQSGEFTQRFQQFLDTVDLFFVGGVNWKAFLTSFQELQTRYGDENIAVQGIERKGQSSFEVRLAVSSDSDKAEVEQIAYARYETNLKQLESQFREQLAARDDEITTYRQQTDSLKDELLEIYRQQSHQPPDMMEVVKLLAARPINPVINVESSAVADQSSGKNDLRNAQFAGGYAETVQRDQIGGTINNYGASFNDITRLINTLRDQAQTFPSEHKDDVLMELEDLETDVQKTQPDQNRIGRRLKRLAAVATTIGAIAGGAATVSGDLNDFTGNVIELTETLGIPIEQVQSD